MDYLTNLEISKYTHFVGGKPWLTDEKGDGDDSKKGGLLQCCCRFAFPFVVPTFQTSSTLGSVVSSPQDMMY